MEMNSKKGMYFTLMTITFLVIFLFVFMIPGYKQYGERMASIEMRVDSINDFVKNLKRDVERGLYISSFRALLATEEFIVVNGEFVKDAETSLRVTILNGTVNNTNSLIMSGSTFLQWVAKVNEEASGFNIQSNVTVHNITVYQDDPWNVKVKANISYLIKDVTDIASWKIDNEIITTSVSILGFEDPIYMVYSSGRLTNIFNQTPYENNYTFRVEEKWNISNLLSHTENSYYTYNKNAPSFLNRLNYNGINSHSQCCGIESLVNIEKVSSRGLGVNSGSSIVDYYYWQDEGHGDYRINYTPSWFKLDNQNNRLERYNASGISCEIGRDCMGGLITIE